LDVDMNVNDENVNVDNPEQALLSQVVVVNNVNNMNDENMENVRRRSSLSEGDSAAFKCWYCEKAGHAKRDCPTLAEDKKN
jgi:aspartate carbamoyltransferase regulatory subunit